MKQEFCAECHKALKVSKHREECEDMCDSCYKELQDRVKFLSDRDNRMNLVRAATFHASNSHSEETRLRCFFASVMPEYPQYKVQEFLRANNKIGK